MKNLLKVVSKIWSKIMSITNNELKILAKSVKKTFTLNTIYSYIEKFISNKTVLETIKKVIGQKGDNKLKNGEANELTAKLLGYKDYATAQGDISKKESLSISEIQNKLQDALYLITAKNSSEYKQVFNVIQDNIENAFKENKAMAEKEKDTVIECIAEGNEDSEALKTELELLEYIVDGFYILHDYEVDSHLEAGMLDIYLKVILFDKCFIEIDAKIIIEESSNQAIMIDSGTINGLNLQNLNGCYDNLVLKITSGLVNLNLKPESVKNYTEEQRKKLSVLCSELF